MKTGFRKNKILACVMALFMVCFFQVPNFAVIAKDTFISQYIQTVYNQNNNGIGSNEVNCLYQSSTGYVWIGTDGGLYRSNGSSFQSINLWDTERSDVYSINCMYQDTKGRMWIGTDNYGLFYIEDGENFHLQDEYYNGIKSIIDICELEDGTIYVATEKGLYTCQKADNKMTLLEYIDSSVSGYEFNGIEALRDEVWALYDNNSIYVLNNEAVQKVIDGVDITDDELNCIKALENGIYIGTSGRDIINYSNKSTNIVMSAGVEGINNIMLDSNGYIWVASDNGLGYFDNKKEFNKINDCEIDSYLSDMIQDYEGNYWISSDRLGVILLSKSKFVDYNIRTGMPETMVNNVYIKGNQTYVGTDDGLIIYDNKEEKVTNQLTDMLNGISVRHISVDSKGNMWISTYRRYGVVKLANTGEITNYGRANGLPSVSVNATLPLKDGNIAVATDEGIAIIDEYGKLLKVYGPQEGVEASNVLCMYQSDNGNLYVGTDGGGIYVFKNSIRDDAIEHYTTEHGLNSNVVTSIIGGNEGLWIGTDNGLCFYKEAFRTISNVEFSNSIYDLVYNEGVIWIIGSMGVLRATEEELLGSDGVSGRYLSTSDGLIKTINTISNSCIDKNGKLYICCNTGIYTLDTQNIPYNTIPPRIKVTAIDIDGKRYEFDDLADGLKIKSDVSRITIDFAVFSYSNRNNIHVEYYLDGFDQEPIVLNGTDVMQAVYTNLDGGVYRFNIDAYNGDGTACEEHVSFIIEKETSFFENQFARVALFFVILLSFLLLIMIIIRVQKNLKNKDTELEKIAKEHEEAVKSSSAKNDYLANMSNEIKTPINAMIAKADELLHIVDEDTGYRDSIKGIYDIGSGIINKVDDIILLAKIEAGKVDVVNSNYSISTMVYEMSEFAVELIGDKMVKFFVEIGENVTDNVIGDEEKINNILKRLIDNAVKYTKEGSITLSVDCYEYGDKNNNNLLNVVFTVSDTGIGIHEDRVENIFEVYNIADNKKNSLHSGNGVGLAIVKGYADIMKADISVESVYGAGTTFTLSINQKPADHLSSGQIISKIEGTLSKEAAEKIWLPDVCALLVDNNDVSREVASKVLSPFDMKVDLASSGVSAIDMMMNNDYDVIFMDLSMPIMSGMDAMKEIREIDDDKYQMLPIIAMDSDAIEENKQKLLSEGFTDSIVKPIEFRRVAAVLKDCLPEDKIKEKINDISKYIDASRYSEGLAKLKLSFDVESAIEKIGGSIDVYNKLVRIYYNQHIVTVDELYDKYDNNIRYFKTKIHAIRVNSVNIGAYDFAKKATMFETAVNTGNRHYIDTNIEKFIEQLHEVLAVLGEYLDYIDSLSGITDEELSQKNTREHQETDINSEKVEEHDKEQIIQADVIDIQILKDIKDAALNDKHTIIEEKANELHKYKYSGEDAEFIEVLQEAIDSKAKDTIAELVTTYIDLKM